MGGRIWPVRQVTKSAEFARPADTNAYAAKDVISNSTSVPVVLTFANLARIDGGSGHITKARVMTDDASITPPLAPLRLHLFHTAPAPIADNAPLTALWSSRASCVGEIDLPSANLEGAGSTAYKTVAVAGLGTLPLPFVCAAGSKALYGILETLGAITPVGSAKSWYVELTAEVD